MIKEIKASFRHLKNSFINSIVFNAFSGTLLLSLPLYGFLIYDQKQIVENNEYFTKITGILILSIIAAVAIEHISNRILKRAGYAFDQSIRSHAYHAIQNATITQPDKTHIHILKDIDTVRDNFTSSSITSLHNVSWIVLYTALALYIHPAFGALAIGSGFISFFLTIIYFLRNQKLSKKIDDVRNKETQTIHSVFQNSEVLQAMNITNGLKEKWEDERHEHLLWESRQRNISEIIGSLLRSVVTCTQALTLGAAAYLLHNEIITLPYAMAAFIVIIKSTQMTEILSLNWPQIVRAKSAYDRLKIFFSVYEGKPIKMRLPTSSGELHVENISVRPPGGDQTIIKDVSFNIPSGKILGIIGLSAAGKSTLSKAIAGVWPLEKGSIKLDGYDLRQWQEEQIGREIGYLPQDIQLLTGTIAENISRFTDFNIEDVVEASKAAGAHEIIQQLPNGYNTLIGTHALKLSGGQAQRIALARAYYGSPSLILLDEPNSNLDSTGEMALYRSLQTIKQSGKTILIITHKTNILSLCDNILHLKSGKIESFGPTKEIVEKLMSK